MDIKWSLCVTCEATFRGSEASDSALQLELYLELDFTDHGFPVGSMLPNKLQQQPLEHNHDSLAVVQSANDDEPGLSA
jgi:hypothetical protein